MSVNIAAISGNVTKDCETRQTASGVFIANFTVANNDKVKTNGEWVDHTHYIPCVMFGKYAEVMSPYITKGKKVSVSGSLRYSEWDTENGKRSKIEIQVQQIELMSKAEKRDDHSEELPF